MRHFLYFPTEAAAQRAAQQLREEGYTGVAVRPPDSEYFEDETPPGTRPLNREWGGWSPPVTSRHRGSRSATRGSTWKQWRSR